MVVVHTRIVVAPPKRESFEAYIHDAVETARRKPGSLAYDFGWDIVDPNTMIGVQIWESMAAYEAHRNSPEHKTQFGGGRERGLLRAEVTRCEGASFQLPAEA